MSIENNKRMREAANDIHSDSCRVVEGLNLGFQSPDRFWELTMAYAESKIGTKKKDVTKIEPMSDQEAKEFGSDSMPFGLHAGLPIDQVPLAYLEWLANDGFIKNLRSYMESRRIRQEHGL